MTLEDERSLPSPIECSVVLMIIFFSARYDFTFFSVESQNSFGIEVLAYCWVGYFSYDWIRLKVMKQIKSAGKIFVSNFFEGMEQKLDHHIRKLRNI